MSKLLYADLFQAAIAFKKLKPWTFMYEDQIFSIEDPDTQRIGYCSISGTLGEHLSLTVYLGTEGLNTFLQLREIDHLHPLEQATLLFQQHSLMCSFESVDLLQPSDKCILQDLNLRFRGKNAWPVCHVLTPGVEPYTIEEPWMIKMLTYALTQATTFAKLVKIGKFYLQSIDNTPTIYHLAPEPLCASGLSVTSKDLPFTSPQLPTPLTFSFPEFPTRIKTLPIEKSTLACDFITLPAPIQDEDYPHAAHPMVVFGVDTKSEMVRIANPGDIYQCEGSLTNLYESLVGVLGAQIISFGKRPQKIEVSSALGYALLKDFCQQSGIKLLRKNLSYIFYESLENLAESLCGMPFNDVDMDDDYLGAEDHILHQTCDLMLASFCDSPQYHTLSKHHQRYAADGISTCMHMLIDYLGEAPTQWTPYGIRTLFTDVIPAKYTAEKDLFLVLPDLFITFLQFLPCIDYPQNTKPLIAALKECKPRALAHAKDPSYWGPAKSFAMSALEANIDFTDKPALDAYMHQYNTEHATTPQHTPNQLPPLVFPTNVIPFLQDRPSRNQPCPCDSGKKYKHCCGKN